MACSVFAVLQQHGHIDQDALATSFATHHDFDRGQFCRGRPVAVDQLLRRSQGKNAPAYVRITVMEHLNQPGGVYHS